MSISGLTKGESKNRRGCLKQLQNRPEFYLQNLIGGIIIIIRLFYINILLDVGFNKNKTPHDTIIISVTHPLATSLSTFAYFVVDETFPKNQMTYFKIWINVPSSKRVVITLKIVKALWILCNIKLRKANSSILRNIQQDYS